MVDDVFSSHADDEARNERPYRSMARPSDPFVHRRELDTVRDLLVSASGGTVGLTTALRGAGGFGKTTLARALCEDARVRDAYPDGVLWAQMRDGMRDADRLAAVQDLVRYARPGERPSFETLAAAAARLREVLDGRRVLLVVDDAWKGADVEPFRGLGGGAAVLVTTRDRSILPRRCRRVEVDAMAQSEAVELLVSGLEGVRTEGAKLDALAKRLGEWPLLLRLVNAQLRELMEEDDLGADAALAAIEADLEECGVTAFDVGDGTERGKAVAGTIEASLHRLAKEDRDYFQQLAVFPEDVDVPLAVLERFWGLETKEARKLYRRFHELSLLRLDRATKTIRLHDVVRQYLLDGRGDLPALHQRLLLHCHAESRRWSGPEGGGEYLWRHLAFHLVGAGERDELRRRLFDFDYLEGKVQAVGVNALLADYDVLGEAGEARTLQEALRLSTHVLSREWDGLLRQVMAGQLLGRLETVDEAGRRLLQVAADSAPLRPCQVRMSRTGGPLIRTLEGHTSSVNAVVRLDENRVVSASADQTLRLWDLSSGETLRALEGHTSLVNAVARLDEDRVVSASYDQTLRLWDLSSGETLRTLEGHTSRVLAVARIDEQRVVSASYDQTLRLWDLSSGETLRTLEGHTSGVNAVARIDELRVVSASSDQTLRLWDLSSGETLRTLEGHTSGVNAVVRLDEGRVVSASSDQTLRVWDLSSGETLLTLEGHASRVNAVARIDEQRVVSASKDHTLRLWDLSSGEPLRPLEEGHVFGVNAVTRLDEDRVVSASSDHTLRLWDVASGETLRTLEGHTSEVLAVARLDADRVVSASADHTLRLWDLSSGETLSTLEGHTSRVNAVARLDEQRVVSASSDHTLRVWDVSSGEPLRTLEGHTSWVNAVARLDEQRVVSASADHTLRVWDVSSDEPLSTLEGHTSMVNAVARLDEDRVVSASSDHTLRLWDVSSGEPLRTLKGHTSGVLTVARLDEDRVVSVSSDHTLRLWDVSSGETLRTLEGHTSRVNAVARLDEDRVVSASADHTLRVWDVSSGETVAVFALDAPPGVVSGIADGRSIVAGDQGGGVHFLDLKLSR